jgi:hypothetical protein
MIKPEELKHLTDSELCLVNLDSYDLVKAWKKEYEKRNRLPNLSFDNYYLTREEFNA